MSAGQRDVPKRPYRSPTHFEHAADARSTAVIAGPRPGWIGLLGAAGLVASVAGCAAASASGPVVTPDLLAKARDRGTVRVIAQLRVEPDAGPTRIETVKSAVLAEIAATRHRVVREHRGLPTIALEASEETLRLLSVSSRILRVQEDVLERPQR